MADAWPDSEQVLSRLRQWLDQTQTEVATWEEPMDSEDESTGKRIGLYELAEQLTAMRHDVKLLTKSNRGAEERNEATLLEMHAAIEQFRSVEANEKQAANQAGRPLVEALVNMDEALTRGRHAIQNAQQKLRSDVADDFSRRCEQLDQLYRKQAWWRRMLCHSWHAAARELLSTRILDTQQTIFESLLEGYDLIHNRLERAFAEQQIIRMDCLGRPCDPNCMTVLETISDRTRPPELVVEEVRPGYYWQGEVFRFAEVKVVASR